MLQVILYSVIAGIVGTTLGGLIGIFFKGSSDKTLSCVLSFAAGIMLGMVCFELFPEANETFRFWYTMLAALGGMLLLIVLNHFVDRHEHAPAPGADAGSAILLRAGIIMILALAVHNVPEGFALGVGMRAGNGLGLRLVLLIALHNIPDGMAIAVSLTMGGVKKSQAVLLVALSGVPTVVGGILGYLLGGLSPIVVAVALSAAGGALLYVTCCEMLPQAIRMNQGGTAAVFVVVGVLVSMVVSSAAL